MTYLQTHFSVLLEQINFCNALEVGFKQFIGNFASLSKNLRISYE